MIGRALGAAVSIWVAPGAASACVVCSPGQSDPAQSGLLFGTLLLSALPIVMIGGIGWFVVRRIRRIDRESAAIGTSEGAEDPLSGASGGAALAPQRIEP